MNKPNPDSIPVKLTLLVSSTLVIMSGATISPALPAMEAHFSAQENVGYWVRLALTIPALFIVIGGPLVGNAIDRLGRKSLLTSSVLFFGIAGSAGLYLDSLLGIIISRAILGLAVAGASGSVTTLIADYYSDRTRATLLGWQSTFIGFTGFLAFSFGGVLADLSWRAPFAVYLAPLLLLPAIAFLLYEPPSSRVRSPNSNSAGDASRNTFNWSSLPLALLAVVYGIEFCHMFFFYVTPAQLPYYLKTDFGIAGTRSGLAIATLTLFQAGIALAYGAIKARLRFASIVALAFGIVSIGYLLVAIAPSYPAIVVGLGVSGLGFGLLFPNAKVWVSEHIPEQFRGRAIAGLNSFFFLGEFLSPIVSQPVTEAIGYLATYGSVSLILGGLALSALGSRWWTNRSYLQSK